MTPRTAIGHHTNVSEPCSVVMMHECNLGTLLERAAFMHHNDKGGSVKKALYSRQSLATRPATVEWGGDGYAGLL